MNSHQELKPSRYNIAIPVGTSNNYILFNTLTKAILLVDSELVEFVRKGNYRRNPKITQLLVNNGILTDERTNELNVFKVLYESEKYSFESAMFTIITTYECNLNCPYCYEGHVRQEHLIKSDAFPIVEFIKKFAEKNNSEHVYVHLYGGEPLLNLLPGLVIFNEVEEWATKQEVELTRGISSNGVLFTQQVINVLSKHQPLEIAISVNGSKKVHDRRRFTRNGEGTYDIIMANIRKLVDTPSNVTLCINLDRDNINDIDKLLEHLEEIGLKDKVQIIFSFIKEACPSAHHYLPLCFTTDEQCKIFPKIWKLALERGFRIAMPRLQNSSYCQYLKFSGMVIDPLRCIYKCVDAVGLKDQIVGKIDERGVAEYYPAFYDWMSRDPLHFESCRSCKFLPICCGGCPLISYFRHGTYDKPNCGAERLYPVKLVLNALMTRPDLKKVADLETISSLIR